MPYLDSLDIANRSCQHLGEPKIASVDEDSRANNELSFAYDKLREAELRRNAWRFSIKNVLLRAIDTDTFRLDPQEWDEEIKYPRAAIAKDENGELWESLVPDNINNEPGSTTAWDRYFGPRTVHAYDVDTAYHAGELVYQEVTGAAGGYVIYRSLQNDNESEPSVANAYAAGTTYHRGDSVSYGGYQWRSLIELNTGNTPAVAPNPYDSTATYSIGNQVVASDGYIYESLTGSNEGNDPVTDGGTNWDNTGDPAAWERTSPTVYASATTWLPIYASMARMDFTYPIGSGPVSQDTTRNVFLLPAGYLRAVHPDPKAGANPFLGAPSALQYRDWLFQSEFVVTMDVGPLVFRFVADITDVRQMDPMFCEGLAARMALACMETITQSTSKKQSAASEYARFMGEARAVNAIEIGSEEPPEDDYITCRR